MIECRLLTINSIITCECTKSKDKNEKMCNCYDDFPCNYDGLSIGYRVFRTKSITK